MRNFWQLQRQNVCQDVATFLLAIIQDCRSHGLRVCHEGRPITNAFLLHTMFTDLRGAPLAENRIRCRITPQKIPCYDTAGRQMLAKELPDFVKHCLGGVAQWPGEPPTDPRMQAIFTKKTGRPGKDLANYRKNFARNTARDCGCKAFFDLFLVFRGCIVY